MENGGSAPTGCYKCGRPGHWSRDCPSASTNPSSNSNPNSSSNFSRPSFKNSGIPKPTDKALEKPKKVPRTRPKLTPGLLLSNDGLGYVLRHFPRSFKFRGRGHEVSDLRNLIGLYAEWHSHLLPYYSFDQFVHKVEKVGATNRVRTCIKELRERVANGGDPSKLHEPPVEQDGRDCEPEGAMTLEKPDLEMGEQSTRNNDADDVQGHMFDEIYQKITEESPQSLPSQMVSSGVTSVHNLIKESLNQVLDTGGNGSSEIRITEEQRTRMEANRLKALERAAARAKSVQAA
ncbi:PREDICTED: TIMELESS-interacting protein isoform X2 [Nelumbo nucifera]|uniref:TIMELESS-interacting protein isoform X2 n=1 Tax=Nelumbo nucifera TaxID=4432 RepID=A0A1U7ZBZ3_NELNU|nr:PREDICTED: TIMELESS-interacting protein isoform X2 [Nelumbo nucifera]